MKLSSYSFWRFGPIHFPLASVIPRQGLALSPAPLRSVEKLGHVLLLQLLQALKLGEVGLIFI